MPEAVRQADVVVLTVPWDSAQAALAAAGDLRGRVLIDATNPVPLTPEGLRQGLVIGHTTSGGEQVACWANSARVVKAFNTTGANNMSDSRYAGHTHLMMPVAGDDAHAKATVMGLAGDLGFDPVDAGPLAMSRHLEPMAMLWIKLAIAQRMGRDFGFALLRR